MKPNRVAFLLNEFPTLTETFILNQIVFLIENGIDIHIFSLYRGNFDQLHTQYRGYNLENRVSYVAMPSKSIGLRLTESIAFLRKRGFRENSKILLKCLNPLTFGIAGIKLTYFLYYSRMRSINDYDLVHVHFGNMGVFFEKFLEVKLFNEVPYLVSFHGFDLVPNDYDINLKLYQGIFQSSKLFTVNSNYTRKLLEKVSPGVSQRIRLLPESLDTSLFENNESFINDKVYRLAFVGRLVSWKGPDRAIEIVEKIVKDYGLAQVELFLIGNGPLKNDLEKMVLEKGLENQVKILGGMSQTEVKAYLIKADLFVYTGREDYQSERAENQGLVLMEAQAMGLPVVAFEVGGIGEGIIKNETGLLVSPEDLETFAMCVVDLLRKPELRIKMGKKARVFVASKFDINILGQELLKIYDEVLK